MSELKVRPTKWWMNFWPPSRKKVKIVQALADWVYETEKERIREAAKDHIIYGKSPTLGEYTINPQVKSEK